MNTHQIANQHIQGIFLLLALLFLPELVEAQAGHMHRATRRRTAVVVSSATHAQDQQNAQAQAAAQTPPPQQTAPAPATTTPPPASTQALLPVGTVVTKLPEGCVSVPINGVQYYQCGANYYLAAYQEGALVYVTSKPPS